MKRRKEEIRKEGIITNGEKNNSQLDSRLLDHRYPVLVKLKGTLSNFKTN